MTIGGAFLGGGVEVVPAGSCKLELEILTEDRKNLGATFTISGGGQTYTATAGADGRAVKTVPSGVTYTVSVNSSGYVNVSSQTVIAESATVKYVRFDAIKDRVDKVSDETIGGTKTFTSTPLIPTPSTSATGREAVNAEWVNIRFGTKNRITSFSTWAELEALIMAGKPGDSFNVTVDFTTAGILGGSEIKGDNSGPVNVHGFGHFFIDEVSSTKVEAFGAGEVSGNFDGIGNSTESYGTTGFGVTVTNSVGMWAFRAPYAGSTASIIFIPSNTAPTSCTGYYLSI